MTERYLQSLAILLAGLFSADSKRKTAPAAPAPSRSNEPTKPVKRGVDAEPHRNPN